MTELPTAGPLEPIEPTLRVFEVLDHNGALQTFVTWLASEVRALVPQAVGVSVTFLRDELTFTVAASDERLRELDSVQYLEGGPCVTGVDDGAVVVTDLDDPLDEARWSAFARASARAGVHSTLSLPLVVEGEVVGGVNLYAAQSGAFDGHVEGLARLVGTRALDAVRDADLGFESVQRAWATSRRVESEVTLDEAAGLLAARRGISESRAGEQIAEAAALAGVSVLQVALLVIDLYDEPAGD